MLFLLPILFAVAWVLSFAHYQMGFLVLFSFLPLLYFLKLAKIRKIASKKVILAVWFASFLGFLGIMAWILSTQPGNWAGIEQKVPFAFIIMVWILAAFVMSVGPLIFIILVTRFKKLSLFDPRIVIIIPGAWIIGEYVRSWLFSLFWYGSGATLGAHWNFGNLGLGLASTPLAPVSRLVGMYGLSFVAIVVNIIIFWLLSKKIKYGVTGVMAIIGVVAVCTFGYRMGTRTIKVGIVQLPASNQDYHQDLLHNLQQQNLPPVQLTVFPEYANFLPGGSAESVQPTLDALFKGRTGLGIETRGVDTGDFQLEKQNEDQSIYFNQSGQILASQDKHFLIPNGEYLPGLMRVVLNTTGNDGLVNTFNHTRAVKKAATPEKVIKTANLTVGSLACSGIVSPQLYQNLARQGADILVNNASLGIFRSSEYFEQAKATARFDAVANNRPFVQATRDGFSYIISANGDFLAETHHKNLDYLVADAKVPSSKTFYSRYGELFLGIITVLFIITLLQEKENTEIYSALATWN